MNSLIFWALLVLAFYLMYALGARRAGTRLAKPPRTAGSERLGQFELKLEPYLIVTGRRMMGENLVFEGKLNGPPNDTYTKIKEIFSGEPVTPILTDGEHGHVRLLLISDKKLQQGARKRTNWTLHWLLFFATLVTTTWAGALHAGVNLLQQPSRFEVGLPYSLGLMLILGAHELGHYFTAKHHGIRVTPPYFVPVPFALGTFGAFIKIESLSPDRKALFDVAVAGPLAGLVFAIPALLVGLHYSTALPGQLADSLSGSGVNVDSSILLALLANMALGVQPLAGGHLLLHPLAFAGWLGLIVTALNLLPIGQLDGGHMGHAMFGSRNAHILSSVALAALFALALFVWPSLMFWAIIVFFIAGTHDMPAANDVSPIDPGRRIVGYLAFILLLLIIIPVPHLLNQAVGVHGPYI